MFIIGVILVIVLGKVRHKNEWYIFEMFLFSLRVEELDLKFSYMKIPNILLLLFKN